MTAVRTAGTGPAGIAPRRSLRQRYGAAILVLVTAHLLVTALVRLQGAFGALLFVPDAPIDLLIRMSEVRRWFDGVAIYFDPHSANYPPASYVLLWPVVGWLPESATRVLFAGTLLCSVAVIGWVGVRASGVTSAPAKAFIALFVLPLGATQIVVWIGQLGLHVTACLLAATAVFAGTGRPGARRASWGADLAGSALAAASLVKPTLSVPVVAAILILNGRLRPWLLTGGFYLALTLLAAAFQRTDPVTLIRLWLGRESIMNLPLGSVNTHLWLHWLGVEGSMLTASLIWLLALCAWTWRHRDVDAWIIVGVAALVGRIWIHHRAFDDVLLVVPVISLLRIVTAGEVLRGAGTVLAALLVAMIYALGHAPYAWLSGETYALWLTAEAGRTFVWMATLAFLVVHAGRPASAHSPVGLRAA